MRYSTGLHHQPDDGRADMYNIYGITNLPAAGLRDMNRSWNYAPMLSNLSGTESKGYEKRQIAYVFTKRSCSISFTLEGYEDSLILNHCFIINNRESASKAHL